MWLFWKTIWQSVPRVLKMFTFFGQRITLDGDYPMERDTNANGAFVPKGVHCKGVHISEKLGIT